MRDKGKFGMTGLFDKFSMKQVPVGCHCPNRAACPYEWSKNIRTNNEKHAYERGLVLIFTVGHQLLANRKRPVFEDPIALRGRWSVEAHGASCHDGNVVPDRNVDRDGVELGKVLILNFEND